MKIYKFYYCGKIPDFFDVYGDRYSIEPLIRVNDEFNLNSTGDVWLYAITDKKKLFKLFQKFRKMDKFIIVIDDMSKGQYYKFMELTEGIYELRVERFLPKGKGSLSYEDVLITTFEKCYIDDSNSTLRNLLRYNHGIEMLDFLANSKGVDSYLRKTINTIGLITMVDELKSEDNHMDDLPYTTYMTNQYTMYYYLFGFTYKGTRIGE